MEVKTPQGLKLFFLDKKERPTEAPFLSFEKKILDSGVATHSWIRP